VQLGLENKKKTIWAAVLGGFAVVVVVYQFLPMFTGSSSSPDSSAQAAAPIAPRVSATRGTSKSHHKEHTQRTERLDPTLRLDLLAASEQTRYEGNGRNIFVSQADPVTIPTPVARGNTDPAGPQDSYHLPTVPAPTPIPLKFFGFASKPGEQKKIFLSEGEDVFVAGEGEIVDRRYKVIHITPNAVEIQDEVNSGPPQSIPLTPG
jgi:hypothetical protein